MWYFGCVLILVVSLWCCDIVGRALSSLSFPRMRPLVRAAYAPALGLATFTLIATVVGWFGNGFLTRTCLAASAILVLAALATFQRPAKYLTRAAFLAAVAVVTSMPLLFPVFRFDAFNPYSDAFVYLVHGQWLQAHGFRSSPPASLEYPAISLISQSKANAGPMGSSFFLAWLQATFHLPWSYLAYPAVVALAVAACSVAVGGSLLLIPGVKRQLVLLTGLVLALTFNGFTYAAAHGFLPQTFGLTFALAGMQLLAASYIFSGRTPHSSYRAVLLPALVFAALTFSYHPLVLPVGAAIVVWFTASAVACRRHVLRLARYVALCGLLTALLVNFEILRVWKTTPLWMKVVVGQPVLWNPPEFVAHALGFLAGPWDQNQWIFKYASLSLLCLLIALLASARGVLHARLHPGSLAVSLPLCTVLVMSVGFCYYRWLTPSPWNIGVGQSWSQLKLTHWASPFALLILCAGLASLTVGSRRLRIGVYVFLACWSTWGLVQHYRLADLRTRDLRRETGYDSSPFLAFHQLRQLAQTLSPPLIYVELGIQYNRLREMIAYFLWDRPLMSTWWDDPYFASSLKPNPDATSAARAQAWLIVPAQEGEAPTGKQVLGGFALRTPGSNTFRLRNVVGGYAEERQGRNAWRWTAKRLEYTFDLIGTPPARVVLHFAYLPATTPRTLRIAVEDDSPRLLQTVSMQPGLNSFVTRPFTIGSASFRVIFETDQEPVRLGTDPRLLSFLIENLRVEDSDPDCVARQDP
jgi:hypothetical protein